MLFGEAVIVNIVFILFPIFFFLIYELTTKVLNIDKQNLFLDMSIISSVYLLIRYGMGTNGGAFILLNVPLIYSYSKKRDITSSIISIILIVYYKEFFNISLYWMMAEYMIYYIIYLLTYNKKMNMFLDLFIISKAIFLFIYLFINPKLDYDNKIFIYFSFLLLLHLTSTLIVVMSSRIEEIINYHQQIGKIEDEKNMYTSLFKITHEIKNPIAVCKGYLDMFDVNNKDHCRKYIPIIKNEIDRVLVLLQDFLSINHIKIEKEIIDINMTINEVIKNFEFILKEKRINLDYYYDDEEIFLEADYNRIKQVLVNIIKNSIEAVGEGGNIKIYYKDSKKTFKIVVLDNGIGMDKEECSHIKEPFFTTKMKGTGLGVFLSNEIILLHGGKLYYKSKKNCGTTTEILIPK